MQTDIAGMFQRKYGAEIIRITPKERVDILKSAESFVIAKFAEKFLIDGGQLSDINVAMTQSLLELFVREKAAEKMIGSMLRIDLSVYESALSSFKEYIEKNFASYELLEAYWMQQAMTCICNTFSASAKVFQTYLVGELCENLYIDNKTADVIIEELKSKQFIYVYGKQQGKELLSRKN